MPRSGGAVSVSIVGTAASSVGVIAGAGLMLTGAAVGAARGFAANDLAATGADIAMQRAVVQGGSLLVNAAFFLTSIALLIWLSSVAVAARRERALSGRWSRRPGLPRSDRSPAWQ